MEELVSEQVKAFQVEIAAINAVTPMSEMAIVPPTT
jgi:hypothetical protein